MVWFGWEKDDKQVFLGDYVHVSCGTHSRVLKLCSVIINGGKNSGPSNIKVDENIDMKRSEMCLLQFLTILGLWNRINN